MTGLFDDLIPEPAQEAAPSAGPFEDLIPPDESAADASTLSETASRELINLPEMLGFGDVVGTIEGIASTATQIGAMSAGGIVGSIYGAIPGTPQGTAAAVSEGFAEDWTYEPRTEQGAQAKQDIGKLAGLGVQGVKHIGAGWAGIGSLPFGIDAAVEDRDKFMETPNAIGEGVFKVTRSPMAATIFGILPDILAMGFGTSGKAVSSGQKIRGIADEMRPGRVDVPEGYGGVGKVDAPVKWTKNDLPPAERAAFAELEAAVQAKDAKRLAEIINANPAIVAAFDELGISYAPQMVSESISLQNVASGLKSAPESGLAAADARVFTQLRSAADEMINRYGSTDRAVVDASLRSAFDADNTRLTQLSDEAFEVVAKAVPQGERVVIDAARDYIAKRIDDLGGGEEGLARASRHEKSLWNLTHRRTEIDGKPGWEDANPTYAALDAYRKNVGKGIDERGIFKDGDQGELKNIYGMTAEAQQLAATRFGVGEEYAAANKAIQERKASEASSETVLGRRMERGANIDPVAMALTKGQVSGFRKLMDSTPPAQRTAVAMSVLDKIIVGAGKGPGMQEGFLKSIQLLQRNPTAKNLLMQYLPKEVRSRYLAIEKASEGFIRSLAKDNRSNTANANHVLKSWEDGTLWAKLGGLSSKLPFAGDWIKQFLEAGPSKRVKAAENFLQSKSLDAAVREYAKGRVDRANAIAKGSPEYNRWLATLENDVRNTVQKEGLMAFLFAEGASE